MYSICVFLDSLSLRLGAIIEATGASTYHGFLPTLVRDCVAAIISAGKGESTCTCTCTSYFM